ncbi:hypothetical protein D3C86_1716110 [compost metagenome]
MATHRIHRTGPTFLGQGLAGFGQARPVDDFAGPQALEVIVFTGTPGGRDHAVPQARQEGNGKTADATVGARHQHLTLVRCHAVALQRQDAQHRGITGGTDGHGLGGTERLGQGNQPIAV